MKNKYCKKCGHREDYCTCPEGPTFKLPAGGTDPANRLCNHSGCHRRWTIAPEGFGPHARGFCRWHYPGFPEELTEEEYRQVEERKKDPAKRLADLIERDRNEYFDSL